MEFKIINALNCLLFPNSDLHTHFTICYKLIRTIKNICINHDIKLLIDLCTIMKMPLTHVYIDTCNILLHKITDLAITISPEYVLYKSLNVPFVEKNNNYVIISSFITLSEIEYFSFLTGEKIKTINTSHTDINKLLRNNNILISCSGYDEEIGNNSVELLDIISGTTFKNIKMKDVSYISSFDNIVAIASFDETKLYNIIYDNIFYTVGIGGPICLTKDLLVGWKDNNIVIINLKTLETLQKIELDEVPSVINIYNDMLIYGGDGENYYIMIFNLKTMKLVKTLKGHTSGVISIYIDDNFLISGSIDNTIKFWDIQTGNNIKTLYGHTQRISSLAMIDNYLISGDWDRKILIWDLNTDKVIRTIFTTGWVSSFILVDLKELTIH